MTIQLNTDKNIEGSERLTNYINDTISEELSRFNDYITRIEVHLSDENGAKEGANDKKCVLEARIKNKQPIAATSNADTVEKALSDSLSKIKAAVGKVKSKSADH